MYVYLPISSVHIIFDLFLSVCFINVLIYTSFIFCWCHMQLKYSSILTFFSHDFLYMLLVLYTTEIFIDTPFGFTITLHNLFLCFVAVIVLLLLLFESAVSTPCLLSKKLNMNDLCQPFSFSFAGTDFTSQHIHSLSCIMFLNPHNPQNISYDSPFRHSNYSLH